MGASHVDAAGVRPRYRQTPFSRIPMCVPAHFVAAADMTRHAASISATASVLHQEADEHQQLIVPTAEQFLSTRRTQQLASVPAMVVLFPTFLKCEIDPRCSITQWERVD